MVTRKHQTWPQGAKPGDPPVEQRTEVVDPLEIERDGAPSRLRDIPKATLQATQLGQAILDMLRVLGIRSD